MLGLGLAKFLALALKPTTLALPPKALGLDLGQLS